MAGDIFLEEEKGARSLDFFFQEHTLCVLGISDLIILGGARSSTFRAYGSMIWRRQHIYRKELAPLQFGEGGSSTLRACSLRL